jgi:hypothetical protein
MTTTCKRPNSPLNEKTEARDPVAESDSPARDVDLPPPAALELLAWELARYAPRLTGRLCDAGGRRLVAGRA